MTTEKENKNEQENSNFENINFIKEVREQKTEEIYYHFINLDKYDFIKNDKCDDFDKWYEKKESFIEMDIDELLTDLIPENVEFLEINDMDNFDVIHTYLKMYLKNKNVFIMLYIYDTLNPNRWDLFDFSNCSYVVYCICSLNKSDIMNIDYKTFDPDSYD